MIDPTRDPGYHGLDPSPVFLLVIVTFLVAVVGTILGNAFA